MNAPIAKKKAARSLTTVLIVTGMISTAIVTAACSKSDDSADGSNEGIGLDTLTPVANAPESTTPIDATPSPDGSQIYYIAYASKIDEDSMKTLKIPAVFTVPAAGGTPKELFEGDPLLAPFNITISDDGQTLFIADSAADQAAEAERSDGRVFSMSVSGGTPTALAGTEGIAPAGIEVSGQSILVTGMKDGQAGLYRTGLAGGAATAVATGAPFADPSGVTAAKDGTAYVVDTGSVVSAQVLGSIVKVTTDGKTEVILDGISVGQPAGIALVHDESALLISGLDPTDGSDRVFRVELSDRSVRQLSATIGAFGESAGLHRARNAEVFAWADSHANGSGTVYVLKP